MTEIIIKKMSQVTISDDLLRQVDMKGLIKDFQDTLPLLDDFKNKRDAHEQRGVGKKFWDAITFDKTMENAQLSATEIQAKFSKSLGQLMVVNVALSQHLNQQQEQLSKQQDIIKDQTQRIEHNTLDLSEQHEILAKQSTELKELLDNFLTFKGMTSERIDQISAIVKNMETIRDSLLNTVDDAIKESHEWVLDQQEKTLEVVSYKINSFSNEIKNIQDSLLNSIEESQSWISDQQTKTLDEVSSKIHSLEEYTQSSIVAVSEQYRAINADLSTEREKAEVFTTDTQNNFTEMTKNLDYIKEDFKAFRENQEKEIQKMIIIFGVVTVALSTLVVLLLVR